VPDRVRVHTILQACLDDLCVCRPQRVPDLAVSHDGVDDLVVDFDAVVTPHDLRHTAASLAVSAGANVKVLQNMLGHASAAMTLDTYSHLFDEDLEAIGIALDQARTRALVGK
jgi:integrase